MKKLVNLLILFLLMLMMGSCSEEELIESSTQKNIENRSAPVSMPFRMNRPIYSNNKLIVQYAAGTQEIVKRQLRLQYQVQSFEVCQQCNDHLIELWIFDQGIDIEPKKTAIEQGGIGPPKSATGAGTVIVAVDYEFSFGSDTASTTIGTSFDTSYLPYIKTVNNGVTIAVFDTGIAPTISNGVAAFTEPFLYNAAFDGEPSTISGWDFVNNDANCFDDESGRHGTIVSSIINRTLKQNSPAIPHQILPIKISNNYGKASYFHFLCGSLFAFKRADILQMSLGWYDDGAGNFFESIFSNLLDMYPNVIVVASAGNCNNNNDSNSHYPSGFSNDNIVAVAATNGYVYDATIVPNWAGFSNHGSNTVDYFATGQNIPFLGYSVQGTSFAAPFVAAKIAKIKYQNPTMTRDQILDYLQSTALSLPTTFENIKQVKYNKVIMP